MRKMKNVLENLIRRLGRIPAAGLSFAGRTGRLLKSPAIFLLIAVYLITCVPNPQYLAYASETVTVEGSEASGDSVQTQSVEESDDSDDSDEESSDSNGGSQTDGSGNENSDTDQSVHDDSEDNKSDQDNSSSDNDSNKDNESYNNDSAGSGSENDTSASDQSGVENNSNNNQSGSGQSDHNGETTNQSGDNHSGKDHNNKDKNGKDQTVETGSGSTEVNAGASGELVYRKSTRDSSYTIKVTGDKDSGIHKVASMNVLEVNKNDSIYADSVKKLNKGLIKGRDGVVKNIHLYHIMFCDKDGKHVTLDGKVDVKITYREKSALKLDKNDKRSAVRTFSIITSGDRDAEGVARHIDRVNKEEEEKGHSSTSADFSVTSLKNAATTINNLTQHEDEPIITIMKANWTPEKYITSKIIRSRVREISYPLRKDGLTGIAITGTEEESTEKKKTETKPETTESDSKDDKEKDNSDIDPNNTDKSTEATTESAPETATEATTEAAPETATEATTETATEATTEAAPETATEATTEAAPETTTEATTEAAPETATEVTTEEKSETEAGKDKQHSLTATDGNCNVVLSYNDDANIPEGASLSVKEIKRGTEEYSAYINQTESVYPEKEDASIKTARFFDIKILDKDGNEVEPAAPVSVNINFNPMSVEYKDTVDLIHFEEGKKKDETKPEIIQGVNVHNGDRRETIDGVDFEAENFSVYGVVSTILTKTLKASDGKTYTVKVTFDNTCGIPDNAELSVAEIKEDEPGYDEYVAKTAEKLGTKPENIHFARAFGIKLVDPETGEKYEPTKNVKVAIKLADQNLEEEKEVGVVHFEDADEAGKGQTKSNDPSAKKLDSAVDGNIVRFDSDGFSVFVVAGFTVDFHWGDYTYSIAGQSEIKLSELFEKLGITEITIDDVEDVTFSNEEYVKVEKIEATDEQAGDWLLKSFAPFNTKETLTLKLKNGQSAEITVTDAVVKDQGTWNSTNGSGTWSIDEDGVLTISGTGEMVDYTGVDKTPWYRYLNKNSGSTLFATKLVFENGITKIGENSFTRAYYVEEINAKDCKSLTTIGNSAFKQTNFNGGSPRNTENPKIIDFSECTSLINIGTNAFSECKGIKYLDISNTLFDQTKLTNNTAGFAASLNSITTFKAQNCSNLKNTLNLSGWTKLATLDVSGCSNLTSINLPNSIVSLDVNGCTNFNQGTLDLQSKNLLSSLDIGGCSKITSLKLPAGINEVNNIPETVTSIYYYGSEADWNLKNIVVPEGTTVTFKYPNSDNLKDFLDGGTYTIGSGEATDINTPALLNSLDQVITLKLSFSEKADGTQMKDQPTQIVSYELPSGLALDQSYTGDNIVVKADNKNISISVTAEGNTLILAWDGLSADESDALTHCKTVSFDLTIPVKVSEPGEFELGTLENTHKFWADLPHDPYVDSVTADSFNPINNTITFTAVVKTERNVDKPVVIDWEPGRAIGDIESNNSNYTITGNESSGEPVAISGFPVTLDTMSAGETVTFTIVAGVDLTKIGCLSTPDKSEVGMTISLANEGNPFNILENDTEETENIDSVTPGIQNLADMSISGEISGCGVDEDDYPYQDITWEIHSNTKGVLQQAGNISDIITFSGTGKMIPIETVGDGIRIRVSEDSNLVETITKTWSDIHWDYSGETQTATWRWDIPEEHVGKKYTYDITFTTRFLTHNLTKTDAPDVNNEVTGHTGTAGSQQAISGSQGNVTADMKAVDVNQNDVTWEINTKPSETTHDSYVVKVLLPYQKINDIYYKDTIKVEDGNLVVSVEGLEENLEKFEATIKNGKAWERNVLEIKFFKKEGDVYTEGLRAKTDDRTLKIQLTTSNNHDWIQMTGQNSTLTESEKIHTNRVEVREDIKYYADAEAVASPQKPFFNKTNPVEGNYKVTDIELEGVNYPAFEFVITLAGVNETMLTDGKLIIEDTLPDDWRLLTESGHDLAAKAYKTETGDYPGEDALIIDGLSTSFDDPSQKATFTLTPPKKGNGYWDYYQIIYHVVPKDADAFHHMKIEASKVEAEETVGEQKYTNNAVLSSGDQTSGLQNVTADFIFQYKPIQKQLNSMDGNWAYYTITVNPDKLNLSTGGLELKDIFYDESWSDCVEQSIDYGSIIVVVNEIDLTSKGKSAFENAGISYDYRGHTGTYQLPDQKAVTISYRTRVSGTAGTEVTFQNTAELDSKTTIYPVTVKETRLIYPGSDDLIGNKGDYYIRLFKYANGHMEYGLEGAEFILLNSNKKPIYDNDGGEILFRTDDKGYAKIRLDPDNPLYSGLSLKKNTVYYLEETLAPKEGTTYYKKDGTLYSFMISDNPNYSSGGAYVFYNNDVLKVRNSEETAGVFISKRFTGNGSLSENEQKEIKFVLEKKGEGGHWTEVESVNYNPSRKEGDFASGSYQFKIGQQGQDSLAVGETYRVREVLPSLPVDSTMSVKTDWIITTVDENGERKTEWQKEQDNGEFTVTNHNINHSIDIQCVNEYIDNKLTIRKVDQDDGSALGGAAFTVYDMSDYSVRTYTTRSDNAEGPDTIGTFDLRKTDDVRYAYDTLYYIVESKAPLNHILPEKPKRIYFYFSSDGNRDKKPEEIGLSVPEGETAIDLSKDYDIVSIENRKSVVSIPVRKAWSLNNSTLWPDEVDHVVIGLYYSVNGAPEQPVIGEDGQPMTVSLTKTMPYDNTKFVNLAAEDAQGNRITYSVREEHAYSDADEKVDIVDDFSPDYTITDADLYVVTNREGVSIQVNKEWYAENGEKIVDPAILAEYPEISFDIYRTTNEMPEGQITNGVTRDQLDTFLKLYNAELVETGLRLNNVNKWGMKKGSLKEKDPKTGNTYYYFVVESKRSELKDTYKVQPADSSSPRKLTIGNDGYPEYICRIGYNRFYTLKEAIQYAEENNIYNPTIEMLVGNYIMPESDMMVIPEQFTVTLKKADDIEGLDEAKITRYQTLTKQPMFSNYGSLILEDITINGDGDSVKAEREMVFNKGDFKLKSGASLLNAYNKGNGGAVYNSSGCSVTISGGTISNDKAALGGGIYNAGGAVTVSGGVLNGNEARSGGAIYSTDSGSVTISGGSLKGNKANGNETSGQAGNGGAIYAVSGTVTINGGTLGGPRPLLGSSDDANTASNGSGGAIYTESATVDVSNGTIQRNSAKSGGAIYSDSGSVTVSLDPESTDSILFDENIATDGDGGAIYAGKGRVTISGGTMSGNKAENGYGGAVYVGSNLLTMSSGVFNGSNKAKNGAAIYINSGSADLSGGNINGNISTDGGALGVGSSGVRLTFSGRIKITENTDDGVFLGIGAKPANVCLDQDSDTVINAGAFSSEAKIGIYVKENVEDQRGVPGVTFGSFANASKETDFENIFSNDRYTDFKARADISGKVLYWGMPLSIEVWQMKSSQNYSYSNGRPYKNTADQKLGRTTVYPRSNDASAISVLAQNLYDLYKKKLNNSCIYANAFTNNTGDYSDYLTTYEWDKGNKQWKFTKRDGNTVNSGVLYLFYANPAYISIENNTDLDGSDPRTLTISDLQITFTGGSEPRAYSIINKKINETTPEGGQTGYGYIVARNGATRGYLLPVGIDDLTDEKLVLQPGDSIKLMLPGGCSATYKMTGSLSKSIDSQNEAATQVLLTNEEKGGYDTVECNLGPITITDTTLAAAGGTYEILFGGQKPICRIALPGNYTDDNVKGLYTSKTDNQNSEGNYEYLFATIKNAVAFADALHKSNNLNSFTIEMLKDYLIPDSDKVMLPSGIDFTFQTSKTGYHRYIGEGNAVISRDAGNKNSFIEAIKNQTYEQTAEGTDDLTNPTKVQFNKVTIQNLDFDGRNLAGSGDGGALRTKNWIAEIKHSNFENFIAGNGGAVFIEFGEMFKDSKYYYSPVSDSMVKDNNKNVYVDFSKARLDISGVSFINCQSISQTNRQGGGAIWTNSRVLVITKEEDDPNNTFTDCIAYDQGGAIFHRIDSYIDGNDEAYTLKPLGEPDDGEDLYNATEAKETLYTGTSTKIDSSDFLRCEAGAAGGMESDASIVKVNGCTFTDCRARLRNGGGFNVFSNNEASTGKFSAVWVYDSDFTNCHADNVVDGFTYYGGGLRSAAKRTYIKECAFDNTSSNAGGSFACSSTNADATYIENCSINNARATLEGGGIYSYAYYLGVINTSITNCSSGLSGGGIYHYRNDNRGKAIIENSTISGCVSSPVIWDILNANGSHKSYAGGGGVYSHTGAVRLTGCTIQNNTTTLDGGGVNAPYSNTNQLLMDKCIVTGNAAGNYGGAACSRGHVKIRNECIIMGNRLSHSNKDLAAGVYIPDGKLLYLEADPESQGLRPVNTSRISENYTSNGRPSNLRLPEGDDGNNSTDGVRLNCDLGDVAEYRVINAKSQGTQFGKTENKFVAPAGFMDLRHAFTADDGSLYGILDRNVDLDKATKVFWATDPICKITDQNDNLLYLKQGEQYFPAVFDKLDADVSDGSRASALSLLRKQDLKLYTKDGVEITDKYTVKLLVENYVTDVPLATADLKRNIVLTSASSSDGDGFPYRGTAGSRSTISRSEKVGNTSLLTVKNSEIALRNIELNGLKDKISANEDTRLIKVEKDHSTVTLSTNARLNKSHATGNGGAVYIEKGNFIIDGGTILNCDAANGGAIYMASTSENGTLTLRNGSIGSCTSSQNGGGIFLDGGEFIMEGGSIGNCSAVSGGGVYVASGNTMKMQGNSVSITGNTASDNGGGIATGAVIGDSTKLIFGGKARVEKNKLNGAECNVELAVDRNNLIYADGLMSGSFIGVYVPSLSTSNPDKPDETLFDIHGDVNKPFATFMQKTDEKYLYCFVNDINGLKGGLLPEYGEPNTAYWVKIFSLRVINNVLSDNPNDKKGEFSYVVTLRNKDSETVATNINGWYGDSEAGTAMYFDQGVANFIMTGESGKNLREADGLPEGLLYEVVQTLPPKKEGYYTVSPGSRVNGEIGENNKGSSTLATKYLSTVIYNNIHAVCKIRDNGVGLLYYKAGKNSYQPAVYSELSKAFDDINRANLYYRSTDQINYEKYTENQYNVEMLIQSYAISDKTSVLGGDTISGNRNVTLKTAASDAEDGYPYSGSTTAVITRDETFKTSLIQLGKQGNLTLGDIILDGNSDNEVTATQNGSLVYLRPNSSLTIQNGATLQKALSDKDGAGIYVSTNSQLNITGGIIKDNRTSRDGAGIYVAQNGKVEIAGNPDFGGSGVYPDDHEEHPGELMGESGNFVVKDSTFKTESTDPVNGDKAYPKEDNNYLVRQDIFIAGYEGTEGDKTAASLIVKGDITSDPGSIWVWAEKLPHYKALEQFAIIAQDTTVTEDICNVFRNAKPDSETENDTGEYLRGTLEGDDQGYIYWNGNAGNGRVILRKVQKTDNNYLTVSNKSFTIYKGTSNIAYTPKGGTELSNLHSGDAGCFWIGELPYGWYIVEESEPKRYFYVIVTASGSYGTLDDTDTDIVGGYSTIDDARTAAAAKYETLKN